MNAPSILQDKNQSMITLTSAQLHELDLAIERVSSSAEQSDPLCHFTFQMCMFYIGAGVKSSLSDREQIEYLSNGDIRMVRPSLKQLLDVRRRAVLRTK